MKKQILVGLAAATALATPGVASAQDGQAEVFVGPSVGFHDLGADTDEFDGFDIDDSGAIFGVVAGVDFPIGETLFIGVEGNFHLGTNAIDSEYGASARFGIVGSNGSKFYVRGGYQEVDIDASEVLDLDDDDDLFDGVDTTEGDYLVGAGADFPVGPGSLRLNVDTIAFDSFRGTAGYVLTF